MAARLLRRASESVVPRTLHRVLRPPSPAEPIAAAAGLRTLHSSGRPLDPSDPRPAPASSPKAAAIAGLLGPRKIWGYDHISGCHLQSIPRMFSAKAHEEATVDQVNKICSGVSTEKNEMKPVHSKVVLFSPLEATVKARPSGLTAESLKIKRIELSQKITYALIPALLLVSKTKLTTSVILLSVVWQIYGFFREIFLDYVHQEVTRKWVLIYFKLLLLIVTKDLLLNFDLV